MIIVLYINVYYKNPLKLIKNSSFCFAFLFLTFPIYTNAQFSFELYGNNQKFQSVRFKHINNLIVIPLEVNGMQLSFILDTGVDKTILFNISKNDSIGLRDVKKITLQGLGGGKPVEALLSESNTMKIGNFVSTNENVYVILKDKFDVSGRMGVTIHGVIGYRLLKDAIIKINYRTKKICFYNPKIFKYRKYKKYDAFPLQFYRNKPYVNVKVQLDSTTDVKTDVKLLIDTGGSDAIWLFENTKEEIKTPKHHFKDILGEGLSGTIYGNRGRIKSISLGKFTIKNPTVSFLDSISTYYARQFKRRNGSIGGNILSRFKIWIDYPNKQILLKKNASFKGGFEYNMSGISAVYNGKVLVKELETNKTTQFGVDDESKTRNIISFVSNYVFRFKPSYVIDNVLEGSPGDIAGLKKGDIIIEINGKNTHEYTLKQLLGIFQERDNKKIKIVIERNFKVLKFQFRLIKRI